MGLLDKAEDEDGVHRLVDIVTEEVSLVDRPANKQPFLVVKRADPMEIEKNEDGELLAKQAKLTISAPVKAAVSKTLTEVVERATTLAKQVKEAEETNLNLPLPAEVGKEVAALMAMLGGLNEKYPSKSNDKDKRDKQVAKAGSKMSKERAAKLAEALDLLLALKDDLGLEGPTPTAGSAQLGKREKGDDDGKGDAILKAVNERFDKIDAAIDGVKDNVAGQTKRLDKVREQVEKTSGEVAESNVIAVEVGKRQAEDKTFWPRDLNRPITKATTPSEVSFYDD